VGGEARVGGRVSSYDGAACTVAGGEKCASRVAGSSTVPSDLFYNPSGRFSSEVTKTPAGLLFFFFMSW